MYQSGAFYQKVKNKHTNQTNEEEIIIITKRFTKKLHKQKVKGLETKTACNFLLKSLTKRIVGVSSARWLLYTQTHAHAHTHRKRGVTRAGWWGWMDDSNTKKRKNEANKTRSVLVSGGSGTRRREGGDGSTGLFQFCLTQEGGSRDRVERRAGWAMVWVSCMRLVHVKGRGVVATHTARTASPPCRCPFGTMWIESALQIFRARCCPSLPSLAFVLALDLILKLQYVTLKKFSPKKHAETVCHNQNSH